MFGWLRRIFRRKGYTCEECGKWIPRSQGRATVIFRDRSVRALAGRKPFTYSALTLNCPPCAEKLTPKFAKGGAE